MKNLISILFFLSIVHVFANCQKSQVPKKLDLTDMINSKAVKNTTDIFELEDLIPLETNQDNITKASTIVVTVDDIFMFSKDQGCILRFDREGKFIGKIGRQGKGPGEFNTPFNLTIIRYNNNYLYVFDLVGSKVIKYSIEGNDYKEINLKGKPFFIYGEMLSEGIFLFAKSYPFHPENHSEVFSELLTYNNKGNLINEFPLFPNYAKENAILPSSFYRFNNSVYFKSVYCDTVFRISGASERQPVYVLSPGNKRPRINSNSLAGVSETNKIIVSGIAETENFILIDYDYNGPKKAVYEKPSGKYYQIHTDGYGLEYASFLWPFELRSISTKEGEFVFYIEPVDLLYSDIDDINIDSEHVRSELIKLQKSVDINDNPIIVIMKEKN